jgi:hypothetical protein
MVGVLPRQIMTIDRYGERRPSGCIPTVLQVAAARHAPMLEELRKRTEAHTKETLASMKPANGTVTR